jgi:hypothetical protein
MAAADATAVRVGEGPPGLSRVCRTERSRPERRGCVAIRLRGGTALEPQMRLGKYRDSRLCRLPSACGVQQEITERHS